MRAGSAQKAAVAAAGTMGPGLVQVCTTAGHRFLHLSRSDATPANALTVVAGRELTLEPASADEDRASLGITRN